MVNYNKVLIGSILIPSIVILRFPALFGAAARLSFAAANMILVGLLRTGNLSNAGFILWKKMVEISLRQRERRKAREIERKKKTTGS